MTKWVDLSLSLSLSLSFSLSLSLSLSLSPPPSLPLAVIAMGGPGNISRNMVFLLYGNRHDPVSEN